MSRTRARVIRDILEVLNQYGEIRASKLMQKANINYIMIKSHIGPLMKINLITVKELDDLKFYSITSKGKEILGLMKVVT